MFTTRGSCWGPAALPDFLRAQLAAHGIGADGAGRCARMIGEHAGAAAASLFVDLGSCKFLEADIDGAIAAWRHAIAGQHDAAASRAMLNLGLLYEHLHLHERAISLFARVAERNIAPYVTSAAMASARCQVAIGDGEQAMETMARLAQRAMVHRPDGDELIETLFGLGEVAEHAGRPDRAERAWQVAAASAPSPIQRAAADNLVRLLLRQGRVHAAVGPATAAASPASEAALARLETIESFIRSGDLAAAAELLQGTSGGALEAGDRFRLVDANLACSRVNVAIDDLEAMLAEGDEQITRRTLLALGRVYANYDMHEPAISMLQRAVASDDPYWMPAAALALGDLLASRGDHKPATEYWSYAAGGAVAHLAELAEARLARAAPVAANEMATALIDDEPGNDATSTAAHAPDPHVDDDPEPSDVSTHDHNGSSVEDEDAGAAAGACDDAPLAMVALGDGDGDVVGDSSNGTVPAPATDAPVDQAADHVEPEPVLVFLDDIDDLDSLDDLDDLDDLDGEPVPSLEPKARPSAFASYVHDTTDTEVANPYAALAPEGLRDEAAATTRNPYAELAPRFDGTDFEPPPDVEPGDWESMLDDWPIDEPEEKPAKRSRAFSRYTRES